MGVGMFQAAWSLALIQAGDAPWLRTLKTKTQRREGTCASLQPGSPSLLLHPTAFLENPEALPRRACPGPGRERSLEAVRRERWGGWRCLPPLDSSGHLCVSDHQKLEREARICRLLKHPNIGEHGGWCGVWVGPGRAPLTALVGVC